MHGRQRACFNTNLCEYVIRIVYIRKNKFQFCAIMSTIKPDEVKTRLFLKDKNYTEQDKYEAQLYIPVISIALLSCYRSAA